MNLKALLVRAFQCDEFYSLQHEHLRYLEVGREEWAQLHPNDRSEVCWFKMAKGHLSESPKLLVRWPREK